ncbi:MAG TPA: hypothetical protein VHU83_25575 [Bryobacteraceae bacterium]|nr:hypothetical protein [Bryobacteraceae bacterium]
MAWSDNVRCLYCDGKLPLYRKITSGQFCSAVHRKAYWQDQERLAVERLHQTHDSLRAYRSPEALEAILGKPAASEPVSIDKYYFAGEPPDVESKLNAEEIARSASNTGNVKFPGFLTEEKPALRAWNALLAAWDVEFAHWPISQPSIPSCSTEREESSLPISNGIAVPLFEAHGLAAQIRAAAEKAAAIPFIAKLIAQVPFAIAPETEELSRAFLESMEAAQRVPEPTVEEAPFPFAERLAALPKIATQPAAFALRGGTPEPQQDPRRGVTFASPAVQAVPRLAIPAVTSMEPLAMTNAPRAMAARAGVAGDPKACDLQGFAQPMELKAASSTPLMNFALAAAAPAVQLAAGNGDSILTNTGAAPAILNPAIASSAQALELRSETSSPTVQLTSPSLEFSLRPAPGCRYDVQSQPGPIPQLAGTHSEANSEISIVPPPAKQLATQSLELSLGTAGLRELPLQSAPGTPLPAGSAEALAARSDLQMVALPDGLVKTSRNPVMAGIRPLAFAATPCAPSAPRPDTRSVAQIYAANAPMNPVAKLEPLDGLATPQRHGFLAAFGGAQDAKHAWTHAADFLQHAPRDLKLLAIAIPILLGLALRPSLPKVRVTAPASTGGISKNLGDGIRAQFVNVRNSVSERAAVALNEDFRSGLDDWQARGDLSSGWSFDGNGFVKPGTLALYRPSLGLRDYDLEFLGLIDKKALSWVVRAKDFDNYYVVKLVVTKAGPLPTMGITRYAVIDGKAQPSVNTVAAINARPDMLYRVTMNVHDDTFLLTMQGAVVDNWTEPRLKRGGIGFFASRGEESRLRWLQVTHQYDMLGRLCAYLAPYNIPTTDGSW